MLYCVDTLYDKSVRNRKPTTKHRRLIPTSRRCSACCTTTTNLRSGVWPTQWMYAMKL